jgi:DNA-binding MarR family transcriptional regulator
LDDEENFPVGRITGCLSNMVRRLINKTFADYPYSGAETGCISFIVGATRDKPDEPLLQKDLEKEFNLRPPTASEMIKKLESKGLLLRESIEGDGRKKRLVPTAKAYEVYEEIGEKLSEMEKLIIQDIPDAEIAEFKKASKKMMKNLRKAVEK